MPSPGTKSRLNITIPTDLKTMLEDEAKVTNNTVSDVVVGYIYVAKDIYQRDERYLALEKQVADLAELLRAFITQQNGHSATTTVGDGPSIEHWYGAQGAQ